MTYMVIIAIILGILFGFSVAANVVGALLLGGMVIGLLGSAISAISKLMKFQILEAIPNILGALFWWWILSICF